MIKVIFYPTYRSNDFCEYSNFWRSEYYSQITEAPVETQTRALFDAYAEGAREVEMRGGEPLVREDLPEVLSALRPSFRITLRTNGILLERELPKYMGLVDQISLLLYHPEPEIHDRILGVEGARVFRSAADTLRKSGVQGEMVYPVTRETITHLPEALDLANAFSMPLRIEPFYLGAEVSGFEKSSLESINYIRRKSGIVYSDQIHKILKADIERYDRAFCTAGVSTITIGPDGRRCDPCVYGEGESGKPGTLPSCASCTDWSYLTASSAKIGVAQ